MPVILPEEHHEKWLGKAQDVKAPAVKAKGQISIFNIAVTFRSFVGNAGSTLSLFSNREIAALTAAYSIPPAGSPSSPSRRPPYLWPRYRAARAGLP